MHSQPFFPKGEVALSLFGEGPAEINRPDLVDFGIALVYIVNGMLLSNKLTLRRQIYEHFPALRVGYSICVDCHLLIIL